MISVESYFEDAVHFIILHLSVEQETMIIRDVEVEFVRSPYPELCPVSGKSYEKLIGLEIKPGFNAKVKEKVAREKGCVHIGALLREAADAVAQTQFYLGAKEKEGKERRKELREHYGLRNICLAYSDEMNLE
jgi:hypothetical protein